MIRALADAVRVYVGILLLPALAVAWCLRGLGLIKFDLE